MATQPKPPPKPQPKPDDDDGKAAAKADASTQPEPVRTIADEQRERSDQIAREGVEKWKADHDERGPDDKPKQVPGVSPRQNDPGAPQPEGGSWAGSTRSTPEARHAQNRGAP